MAIKMPKFVKRLIVIAGLLGLGWLALQQVYPSATFRYKITVSVETPEGIKTGSAVRELSAFREPQIFPEQPAGHAGTLGEAVVVDLGGDRGLLFALRDTNDAWPVLAAFNLELTADGIRHIKTLLPGAAPVSLLAIKHPPTLVRFKDLNDSKSVQVMFPDAVPDIFADKPDFLSFMEAYGPNVKLKDITIEVTDEPVTRGVVDRYAPYPGPEAGYYQLILKSR